MLRQNTLVLESSHATSPHSTVRERNVLVLPDFLEIAAWVKSSIDGIRLGVDLDVYGLLPANGSTDQRATIGPMGWPARMWAWR